MLKTKTLNLILIAIIIILGISLQINRIKDIKQSKLINENFILITETVEQAAKITNQNKEILEFLIY